LIDEILVLDLISIFSRGDSTLSASDRKSAARRALAVLQTHLI